MKFILLRSKRWIIVVSVLSLMLTSGCWDEIEIEKRTVVAALAVDKSPLGYEVSIQVPNPRKTVGGGGEEGGGSGGGEGAVELFSGKGRTFQEALMQIENETNFPLFTGHTQIMLISEELAKEGTAELMDGLRRSQQIRRHLWPVVVQGKAKDALNVQVRLEEIPIDYLREMIETGITNQRFSSMVLGEYFEEVSNPTKQAPMLNVFRITDNRYLWRGIAVFKGDRLLGTLKAPLVNTLMHVREQKAGWPVLINCPKQKGEIVFLPKVTSRQIHVSDDKPQIDVKVKVEGEITVKECTSYKLDNPQNYQTLSYLIQHEYDKSATKLIQKAQKEYNTDIFTFGKFVKAYYPKMYQKLNWEKNFSQIPIRIHYDVDVRRVGLESK